MTNSADPDLQFYQTVCKGSAYPGSAGLRLREDGVFVLFVLLTWRRLGVFFFFFFFFFFLKNTV